MLPRSRQHFRRKTPHWQQFRQGIGKIRGSLSMPYETFVGQRFGNPDPSPRSPLSEIESCVKSNGHRSSRLSRSFAHPLIAGFEFPKWCTGPRRCGHGGAERVDSREKRERERSPDGSIAHRGPSRTASVPGVANRRSSGPVPVQLSEQDFLPRGTADLREIRRASALTASHLLARVGRSGRGYRDGCRTRRPCRCQRHPALCEADTRRVGKSRGESIYSVIKKSRCKLTVW